MNGSHSVLYFMSSKKPETADSGLVLQQWLSLSMLILSTMLTEIRVYIFKTFQPKFQLIKQVQMGRRACVIDEGI